MPNPSIQSKRFLGGTCRFCEHAIHQGKRTYEEKKGEILLHKTILCRVSLNTSTLTSLLSLIDGQSRHFDRVTNDIGNHERLENVQNKINT